MTAPDLHLREVEVDGRVVDVAVAGGSVAAVGERLLVAPGALVVDGQGGALIPGLHDHHLHLLATAAARASVPAGPPPVRNSDELRAALRDADRRLALGQWIRAVGYHETVAGDLDRAQLDRWVPDRPVRVQHRSGAQWTLNSAALDVLSMSGRTHAGLERDRSGALTGRLHRGDDWLRTLLPEAVPDLAGLGADLAGHGVTGVTDTTPSARRTDLDAVAQAAASGALPQRVTLTGGPTLTAVPFPASVARGAVKIVIDDGDYPALDAVANDIRLAHEQDRPVAVHCVTRTALVLALAAWRAAGPAPGDRVEHAAVVPTELIGDLAALGLTVVTQPGFIGERGDVYLAEVDPDDVPHLYRCASLLDAGIPVAGSTDAPYTSIDPWAAMRAAVRRTAPSGAVLGAAEALTPRRALGLFLGAPDDPGGTPRRVVPGAPADLCLLAHPMPVIEARLTAEDVVATIVDGRIVHHRHRPPPTFSGDPGGTAPTNPPVSG